MKNYFCIPVIAAAFCVTGCLSSKYAEQEDKVISGIVTDSRSKGIEGVLVYADKNHFALTDKEGMFVIFDCRAEVLECSKKNYVKETAEINRKNKDCFLQVKMMSVDESLEEVFRLLDAGLLDKASEKLDVLIAENGESFRVKFTESLLLYLEGKNQQSMEKLNEVKEVCWNEDMEKFESSINCNDSF